jgi:anti-sigma regulatory factor (Ser/Thr protein kinase)
MEIIAPFFVHVAVQEETQPGSARREAARLAALEGMPENDVGRVSVVVTEAAKNVVKHGLGGEMLLRGTKEDGSCAIDVLALDKGKGIYDLDACMRDGYSTSGTPGTGMGAMQRMSDVFDVYSVPGSGTVIHCRITSGHHTGERRNAYMETGVVMVPVTGETCCGDGWAERHTETHSVYMVVDGLGHGAGAAEAAEEAIRAFHRVQTVSPLDIVEEAHFALRKTRGAALSVASIERYENKVRYAGVGNVSAAILSAEKSQSMVSHNGIVGHTKGRLQDFTYAWVRGATLVMQSDGIATQSSALKYPGLLAHSPLIAAAVIYRDHSRRRDDATVLIARERVRN